MLSGNNVDQHTMKCRLYCVFSVARRRTKIHWQATLRAAWIRRMASLVAWRWEISVVSARNKSFISNQRDAPNDPRCWWWTFIVYASRLRRKSTHTFNSRRCERGPSPCYAQKKRLITRHPCSSSSSRSCVLDEAPAAAHRPIFIQFAGGRHGK